MQYNRKVRTGEGKSAYSLSLFSYQIQFPSSVKKAKYTFKKKQQQKTNKQKNTTSPNSPGSPSLWCFKITT